MLNRLSMHIVENQRLNIAWVNWISFGTLLLFIFMFINAVSAKTPVIAGVLGVCIMMMIAIIWLTAKTTLKTEYTDEGITYLFFPFVRSPKSILLPDVKKMYLKTISPIGEFGGYGLRLKGDVTGYIVSPETLYVELKSGKTLAFSVSNKEEIQAYIDNISLTSVKKYK